MTISGQAAMLRDAGTAGEVWRNEKASDFEWRARCLGLDTDPVVAELLARIASGTSALNTMWEEQQISDHNVPWWADGEYDGAEADRQNDAGAAALKQGRSGAAFDHFTAAIRLCPRSATYHANRASAALRLKRASVAAEDAANAVLRDPSHLQARVRGGRAALQLRQPEAAAKYFGDALWLDPKSASAQAGLAAALQLAAEEQREAAAAAAGTRPPLPDVAPSAADAAEALLAADAMLAANPGLQAARAAHMEALILARRFAVAAAELDGLSSGPDRSYLVAETAWRQGDLPAAVQLLEEAESNGKGGSGGGKAACGKCGQLLSRLLPLAAAMREAESAHEAGVHQDCIEACGRLLEAIAGRGASGLEARVLRLRGAAAAARGQLPAAKADLAAAVEAQPGDVETLLLQAEVLQQSGDAQEALLALQAVMAAAPATPGLLPRLQAAAALAMRHRSSVTVQGAAPAGSHYAVLGVSPAADAASVRSAYRRLAGTWHPDKWATGTEGARRRAAEEFLAVQRAYETLSDEGKRALYDARHLH